jgi:hypothetical protein
MPDKLEKRTSHVTKFHDLTEEEYDALDEQWTKNPPKPGPNGTGFFAMRKAALTDRKTPVDIIGEMAREQIVAVL